MLCASMRIHGWSILLNHTKANIRALSYKPGILLRSAPIADAREILLFGNANITILEFKSAFGAFASYDG